MTIANKEILSEYAKKHSNAVKPLNQWVERVQSARWKAHTDLKAMFPSANCATI